MKSIKVILIGLAVGISLGLAGSLLLEPAPSSHAITPPIHGKNAVAQLGIVLTANLPMITPPASTSMGRPLLPSVRFATQQFRIVLPPMKRGPGVIGQEPSDVFTPFHPHLDLIDLHYSVTLDRTDLGL